MTLLGMNQHGLIPTGCSPCCLFLIVIKYSINREEWSRTVSISLNNGFLMSRTIAARELRQISLQQMKILNTVIKPRSQHPCKQVSRKSRHIVWRPSALNSGASGLPKQIFFFFLGYSQNKMWKFACRLWGEKVSWWKKIWISFGTYSLMRVKFILLPDAPKVHRQ